MQQPLNKPEPVQQDLLPELSFDRHWFHVTRSMFMGGVVKEMGPVAYAVYNCIKAHTALDSGRAFPSQQRIAEQCGISIDTVARATDKLIEMGYIQKEKAGRRNEYVLTEKFKIKDAQTGQVVAQAQVDYVPLQFQKQIQELERFCRSGVLSGDSRINITFNVNLINQGDHSTVQITQVAADVQPPLPSMPSQLSERLRKLQAIDAIDS